MQVYLVACMVYGHDTLNTTVWVKVHLDELSCQLNAKTCGGSGRGESLVATEVTSSLAAYR